MPSTDIKDYWRRSWGIGDRVGFQSGQLVRPGVGRQGYAGVEPISSHGKSYYRLNITPSKFGPGIDKISKDKVLLEYLYKKYLDNNPKYKKHVTYLENWESDMKKLSKTHTQKGALDVIEERYGAKPAKETLTRKKFKFQPHKYEGSLGHVWSKWIPEKYTIEVLKSELKSGKSTTQMAKEIFKSNKEMYLKMAQGKELTGSTLEGYATKRISDKLTDRIGRIPELKNIHQDILKKQEIKKTEAQGGKTSKQIKTRKRYLREKKVQGKTKFTGRKEFPFHHIMPIGGETPISTKDVAIISRQMNSVLSPYNTKLNDLADEIADLINDQPENYLKKIEKLNDDAKEIINTAKKKLPKKYEGLIGFNRMKPIFDEYGTHTGKWRIVREGIDDAKSLAGAKGKKELLLGMSLRRRKEIQKEINAKINKFLNVKDQTKLSSTIQSIINKKNSGLNVVDIARWGSAELSALDDIAGKLPSKALSVLGKLLKTAGIAAIPLDLIPYAQEIDRGMGMKSIGTGTARLLEDFANMPKYVTQLAGMLLKKDLDVPWGEATFGRRYADWVAKGIPLEQRIKNIEKLALDEKYRDDILYSASGEADMIGDVDVKKLKEEAEVPLLPEKGELEIKETDNIFGTEVPTKNLTGVDIYKFNRGI